MTKSEILQTLANVTDLKHQMLLKNGTDRLVQLDTSLQFVKTTISSKCSEVKHNKQGMPVNDYVL